MKTPIAITLMLMGTLNAPIVATAEHPRSVTMRHKLLVGEPAIPSTEPSQQMRIFHLQHTRSDALLKTMRQLKLLGENLSAATPRTNLIVLRGDAASIEEASALIHLLEQPTPPAIAETGSSAPNSADNQRSMAAELQRFQGIWPMDICDSENATLHAPQKVVNTWKWSIRGHRIAWSRSGDEVWHLAFSIDPTKSPREIDLTYLDGPFKGVTCLGVYQWGGLNKDMLMLSLPDPGAAVERPKTITMTSGEQTSLIFLNPREPANSQDAQSRHQEELDSLQGPWSLEIIQTMSWPKPTGKGPDNFGQRSERQWVIRGNEITWTSQTGREEKLTFTIDPTQSPKQFDVKFLSGLFRGKESLGIYERGGASGKMLWLCLSDPLLNTARPSKFGMDSISRHTLIGLMPAATTPDAASEDERISAIEGRLLQLNEPGSIMVVISLGADDGVKSGDILTISRKGKPIGRLKVSRVERDQSTAAIVAVEDVKTLEVGDQVTNQQIPDGLQAPVRQLPQNPDVQRIPEVPAGVLSGRFVYDGESPVAEDLYPSFAKLTSEQSQQLGPDGRYSGVEAFYREYLRHNIRPTTTDQSLRIGKERGLADVVIWVVSKDIPWTPPPQGPAQATIQIQNASFQPRVIALTVGQPLIIDNKDPVDQSLSAMFSRTLNPPFNILLKAGSTDSSTMMTFSVPEPFPARLSLDRCPWSKGLLFVHDNPYVAISQEDGSFRMPNLPPGEWEFQVWHQRSGYVSHWPKGRFTRKITPGDNNLGAIQLEPGQFEVGVADEPAPLVGEWRVVSAEMGGEPRDKLNFDGMRWTFGTETLEIGPGTFTPAGAAARPPLKCSYTVDNTQDPAHFNWTLGEGEQSIKVNAIYELKDDILRVCFPQHGEPRPDGFATKGHKWTVYELERDPQK